METKTVKNYKILLCERKEIKNFIEKWHYSHNINGLKSNYCFKLLNNNEEIIGAMIYGKIAMGGVWQKYTKNKNDLIELRRLCCIDDTLKNTESYFISQTIKWIKNNTNIKTIISYADPEYNHKGIIYRASNFKYIGKTSNTKVIIYNNKKYHDKTIRTKYKGKIKPYAQKIKNALITGEAFYKKCEGKYIYLYNIKNKHKKR